MKQIIHSGRGLRRAQIWFNEKERLEDVAYSGVDLVEFKESRKPLSDAFEPFNNGVLSLEGAEEALFESLTKGFRYEVRRAQKEGISTRQTELSGPDGLTAIHGAYDRFCVSKKLDAISLGTLEKYKATGNLCGTMAWMAESGDILQYHLYFRDEKEAILLASFSGTEKAGLKSQLFGYGNRLLHWEDMLLFKSQGLQRYNLGGIGNPGSTGNENIIKFKMEMSPKVEGYYNAVLPVSLKGKIYMFLRRKLKGWH